MDSKKILIVDDEERIRDIIKEYFLFEDYIVDEASNGVEGLEFFKKNDYDLILLDIMMPKIDGWGVCREIRKTSTVPIIMLTARGEEYDKLFGFELGVDDYIIKPFSPKEVVARAKAIIRRNTNKTNDIKAENKFEFKGFKIEFESRNVYIDKSLIQLTPKEYELIKFFVQNQNQVFSRNQLLDLVWGYDFIGDDRTVDTHIKMLREDLGEYRYLIVTVWGTGYKFEVGAEI